MLTLSKNAHPQTYARLMQGIACNRLEGYDLSPERQVLYQAILDEGLDPEQAHARMTEDFERIYGSAAIAAE